MAKKYSRHPSHIQRLVSAGNVGLIVALDKFEIERGTKFLTYAAWWIQKEIREELYNGGLVRIPSHKQKTQRKKQKLGAYTCVACGLQAHDPLIACKCSPGLSPEYFQTETLEDECLTTLVPIDNVTLIDEDDAEFQYIDSTMADALREAITSLAVRVRDQFILIQYYDVARDDRKNGSKTLPEIAEISGVTPERVRQVKMKVLKELKKELQRRSLRGSEDICR
jgi:RNA polymerase primary sigma factor